MHLLAVLDEQVLGRVQLLLPVHELSDILRGGVVGGIVDEDNMVVGVFLHEDGVHVVDVAIVSSVIVGWHHHADRELLVMLDVVFVLVVGSLGISEQVRALQGKNFSCIQAKALVTWSTVMPV